MHTSFYVEKFFENSIAKAFRKYHFASVSDWGVAYELENIEAKISENISVAASENLNFDVPEFLRELDLECSKVRKAFKHQVVTFENELLVKRYFHFHQESLIDLIDTLHTGMQTANPFRECVIDRLSGLLKYVEEHFPEYFNQDMKMPIVARQQASKELSLFRESITSKFGDHNVDIGLVELLKSALSDFEEGKESISFRRLNYLRLLRENILDLTREGMSCSETIDLIRVLLHYNYNTQAFYSYLVKYVTWSVNKASLISEKLDHLAYYLKFSNQEYPLVGVAFDHNNPPINIQLAEWISQEIQYLKSKRQLLPTISAEEVVPSDFRINFNLSVSQVAFLFRTFIEAGVIQNENTAELIRFLTKYVKTKRSESISYESFRIKYYSVEAGTKDAVKKTLQSILTFIAKN
jgi:hypothetical protein